MHRFIHSRHDLQRQEVNNGRCEGEGLGLAEGLELGEGLGLGVG